MQEQKQDMAPKRYAILNTYVNALSMDETVNYVKRVIERRMPPVQHVVINALKVNLMEKDPELRGIVNACPLINADGASILWAAKKLGLPVTQRVTGIDLFLRLVEEAAQNGYKIYLFGAKPEVVAKVQAIFKAQYPALQIVGARNGYFKPEDEPQIVADMAASGADMMFVAFSSPKKEYWVHQYLEKLNIPFVMGVGGSFDVVAGVTKRAPELWQRLGLEWLYRFVQEPRRLFKRYIVGNVTFIRHVRRAARAQKKQG